MKTNGKVSRTVVRSALMYGAETWALKMAQEYNLDSYRNQNVTTDVPSYEAGQYKK